MSRHPCKVIAAVLVVALALSWAGLAHADAVYDFESLSIGPPADLDGQDGWANSKPPNDDNYGTMLVAPLTSPWTGSRVIVPYHLGGLTPNVYSYHRTNNPSLDWNFTPFGGSETAAYIQFDCIVNDCSTTSNSGSGFNLYGGGSSSPGIMVVDNFGPDPRPDPPPMWRVTVFPSGGGQTWHTADIGDAAAMVGDWVRVRLTMDFTDTTDGHHGTAALSYINLSKDPEADLTPVDDLQNIDMELDPAAPPSGWNTLAVWLDRTAHASTMGLDNLTVSGQGVIPEPVSMAFMGIAFAGVVGWRLRRRRRARRK